MFSTTTRQDPEAASVLAHSDALDDYDYPLPDDLIARFPLTERDGSRMMRLDRAGQMPLAHLQFKQLPEQLRAGDLLVINNTQVMPARLQCRREGHTGQVHVLLLHPQASSSSPEAEKDSARPVWRALVKPARKLSPGTRLLFEGTASFMEVLQREAEGYALLRLYCADDLPEPTAQGLMQAVGQMPIPPYLNREPVEADKTTYQTVFSKVPGSQAAPTAGLHFTPHVLQALAKAGVNMAEITLSVGAGTFRPILTDNIQEHRMDPEWYHLPAETVRQIEDARARGGRIIAVGTTVAKTLETVAHRHKELPTEGASGWSDLFIRPGFAFRVIDGLLTNFHLPKSTLLLLVSAFSSRDAILHAYQTAVAQRYRFYSYGDCMLLL
ncbi:MAG: tRNA preQ1(34) S-adenosylmethionine ribosyltransferase-isomerase QueA [Candidatus Melainabacteria bacterium]|nr:tRNA preQ1(34) S-adenosylmethionine ribosyltransferase-isomerase QueA [Candidatus Melainabacteria bacterium]